MALCGLAGKSEAGADLTAWNATSATDGFHSQEGMTRMAIEKRSFVTALANESMSESTLWFYVRSSVRDLSKWGLPMQMGNETTTACQIFGGQVRWTIALTKSLVAPLNEEKNMPCLN